jgi:hypothetical protein
MANRILPEPVLPITPGSVPAPGFRDFAILGGLESSMRGILVSVWPLVMYQALGDAGAVSWVYTLIGAASLCFGMLVPWFSRLVPRRWLYTAGAGFYLTAAALGIVGGSLVTPLAYLFMAWGTVTVQICVAAYLMDYIAREDLGKSETLRLFYSAAPWAVGPVIGVTLWKIWPPLPFLVGMVGTLAMLGYLWQLRMGNGKTITRARGPAPNPLAYVGRFIQQPRLVAGWIFAVLRSAAWWVYIVYLPIFCIQNGLGDRVASYAFSVSNLFLFLAPFMLRWMQRMTLRRAVRISFASAGTCFVIAAFGGAWPPLSVLMILVGSFFLVMLDTFGSLPFLMAVRPAERTEMSAIYTSFRDVSGILTPGVAWLVLLVAPVAGVFAVCGAGLGVAWAIAARLHPRLGRARG